MTYKEAADKAEQAAVVARRVQESSDDPIHQGLAEAIALLGDALKDMSETHHRQF